MNMWAGAGVGGLRTPARCLDSDEIYPSAYYLNLCIAEFAEMARVPKKRVSRPIDRG